jgi:hypothetical protein
MKQFEHPIHRVASEVQGLDCRALRGPSASSRKPLIALHGKLASIYCMNYRITGSANAQGEPPPRSNFGACENVSSSARLK